MKGLCVSTWLLAVFLLSALSVLAADDTGEAVMPLQSVQADFTQEKHLKILARPITSRGRFVFLAPQSLRWEYQEPFRSILLMHDGKIRKFTAREGELEEERGMQVDAMQLVLSEISVWLDGNFTETATFAISSRNDQTITLTPKDPSFKNIISRIELGLADRAGLLDSVTIFEGGQSYTKLVFTHAVLNQPIPVALLTNP